MGCEPTPDTRARGRVVQLGADAGGSPRAPGGRAAQHTEQRTHGKRGPQLQPWVELLPCPAVHPDLAALTALAVSDQDRTATYVKVTLGERECFADPQSGAPEHDDQATQPDRVAVVAGR